MRASRHCTLAISVCALTIAAMSVSPARADELMEAFQLAGAEGAQEELRLWELIERERFVKAREDAEKYLAAHPDSFVAELSLGVAQHFGEANFPMALFHLQHALELFEARYGPEPLVEQPWRWHARILRELARTHADLEHYDQQLAFIELYNARYTPLLIAERAWPLMKQREFDLARRAAEEGLATDDPYQVERALNALCTIEFEMGHVMKSYDACSDAVDFGRDHFGSASVVDLSNYAEAARSVFRFDEVEQILMEATRARQSWYGSPWLDLADLYMRGGRFAEALSALREVPRHRAARPPHVRDADRNEGRRSLASFLLLMGRVGTAAAAAANLSGTSWTVETIQGREVPANTIPLLHITEPTEWDDLPDGTMRLAATVKDPGSGRVMEVHTNQPGLQFYTGNWLDGSEGSGGYAQYSAYCLETQHYPDSPNQESFPGTLLNPEDEYVHKTVHKFSVQ